MWELIVSRFPALRRTDRSRPLKTQLVVIINVQLEKQQYQGKYLHLEISMYIRKKRKTETILHYSDRKFEFSLNIN